VFGANSTAGNATITLEAGSRAVFEESAAGGNAVITTAGAGANLNFFDNSTGGNAQLITNGGGLVDFSLSTGPTARDRTRVRSRRRPRAQREIDQPASVGDELRVAAGRVVEKIEVGTGAAVVMTALPPAADSSKTARLPASSVMVRVAGRGIRAEHQKAAGTVGDCRGGRGRPVHRVMKVLPK